MFLRTFAFLVAGVICLAQTAPDPWHAAQQMSTAELAQQLQSGKPPRIFMVGPRLLYNGNHIRGATFAGPAGTAAGLALLKEAVAGVGKSEKIVLYCGCCPMDHCPNIRPAFIALRDAGFKDVRIVDIPMNLPTDWTAKGFPVEKGAVGK